MTRLARLGADLHSGEVSYDFIGNRRTWYATSGVLLLIALLALTLVRLDLGVEFKGGAVLTVDTRSGTVEEARDAVSGAGIQGAIVTQVNDDRLRVTTRPLTEGESALLLDALAQRFGVAPGDIDTQVVGATWGERVTQKALTGLLAFLVLVAFILTVFYAWRLALAALIALLHDLVLTVGVYALLGLEVTPATVVGVLMVLTYSLYDTVVVFDKVRENTAPVASGDRAAYGAAANRAVNQTVVRSLNTSLVALLPVVAMLVVGGGVLGAGPLTDLAVVLVLGIAVGTYSSLFIATPLVFDLKRGERARSGRGWVRTRR